MLLKELTEDSRREHYMGMRAPIGMREPPSYDHVLMELIGVDNFYLRCSPIVGRGGARIFT